MGNGKWTYLEGQGSLCPPSLLRLSPTLPWWREGGRGQTSWHQLSRNPKGRIEGLSQHRLLVLLFAFPPAILTWVTALSQPPVTHNSGTPPTPPREQSLNGHFLVPQGKLPWNVLTSEGSRLKGQFLAWSSWFSLKWFCSKQNLTRALSSSSFISSSYNIFNQLKNRMAN